MNKKRRHTNGGTIRCPSCQTQKPRCVSRHYNIKSNHFIRNYRCRSCNYTFKTIELEITDENFLDGLSRKHKPASSYTILHELYFKDFNKFLEQYIQTDEFKNLQDFLSKISKISSHIDKYIYLTSQEVLPEDTEIITYEDEFL